MNASDKNLRHNLKNSVRTLKIILDMLGDSNNNCIDADDIKNCMQGFDKNLENINSDWDNYKKTLDRVFCSNL
ncbi:MAG: hypothetical protein HQK52_17655 [Oligoflexia bacterium]|nr:hypothetical protein [Oligoflexia bacterium]